MVPPEPLSEPPEPLPDVIRCINVSGQQWFDPKNVNCRKRWSYMSLMRLALTQLLPEEHLVLWLDIDTIVNVNPSPFTRGGVLTTALPSALNAMTRQA